MSISVQNLTKRYGEQKALDHVSFEIKKGEIVGLLGPNGAGKTTTMKIISGFLTTFEGEVLVNDLSVREDPLALKRSIGYLPEHNPLYLEMYVKEYLSFMADLFKLPDRDQRISDVVDLVGLAREQHKLIGALSKGYRQRVGLAQALIHDPQVLVLDEPTTGLDPNQLIEIRHLIRSIAVDKTIIFSSHIMQEVQALCDRVVILNRGKLVADEQIEVLENTLQDRREVIVELDKPVSIKWSLPNLVQVEELQPARFRMTFSGEQEDPRLQIFDFVVARGARIVELKEVKSSVEDVFHLLTLSKS